MPLVISTAHFIIFLAFNWLLLRLVVHFWWARKRPYRFATADCRAHCVALSFLSPIFNSVEKDGLYYVVPIIGDREFKKKVQDAMASVLKRQKEMVEYLEFVVLKRSHHEGVKLEEGEFLHDKISACFVKRKSRYALIHSSFVEKFYRLRVAPAVKCISDVDPQRDSEREGEGTFSESESSGGERDLSEAKKYSVPKCGYAVSRVVEEDRRSEFLGCQRPPGGPCELCADCWYCKKCGDFNH